MAFRLVEVWSVNSPVNETFFMSPFLILQSDLMERSAEISSACYQVEGIRQSSRGRLHLYYLAYNYTRETNPKNESGDITLVAQLSIDRLGVSLIYFLDFFTIANL